MNIATNSKSVTTLYCDNQAAIAYTKDPKYNSKTKYMDIKYNLVRDKITSGEVNLQYIHTREMIVNHFIEALSRDLLKKHVTFLGLCRIWFVL